MPWVTRTQHLTQKEPTPDQVDTFQMLSLAGDTLLASILETLATTFGRHAIYPGQVLTVRKHLLTQPFGK